MIACLDGWLKRHEYFYCFKFDELSGYRRILDATGSGFLFVFSHNRTEKIVTFPES
jgi:hypothetical protein